VAKQYGFHNLVREGNVEIIHDVARNALKEGHIDQDCIKEVLLVIFFDDSHNWGRKFGHLFENRFSLEVLALAATLVRKFIS
jgi:hypothetical protein